MKPSIPFVFIMLAMAAPLAAEHRMYSPDDLEWSPLASLPAGAEVAVLEGNPGAAGAFTMRIKVPPRYVIPPHWHPTTERVTVITGVFHMGMGETVDRDHSMALGPGAGSFIQPETVHFAWTGDEGATIQLHGTGPWAINYVNPEDDPRRR